MLSYKNIILALISLSLSASAAPILRREVPQEHSHEKILTSVGTSLNTNNPQNIQDPVFALLGDAAAAAGEGDVTDTDCLQQAVADQAFTNAKAAGDIDAMTDALIFRALERNTAAVGALSTNCTETATNPEIAALSQHQDPAADGAAANNKAVTLALAQQIASIGGNTTRALEAGTFAPGKIGDPTAAGNTCDDPNDATGCIITQNLLVDDVTIDEINAAVAGISASTSTNSTTTGTTDSAATASTTSAAASAATSDSAGVACSDAVTVTGTTTVAGAVAAATASATTSSAAASTTTAVASGANLQTFTGDVGGSLPPAVEVGGRGFVVTGSDDFLNLSAALTRSCSIQHNACADAANDGSAAGVTAGDCDTQETQCNAAATSASTSA